MLIFSFSKITNKWSKIQVAKHEKYQLSTCYTITYAVICINEASHKEIILHTRGGLLHEFYMATEKQIIDI